MTGPALDHRVVLTLRHLPRHLPLAVAVIASARESWAFIQASSFVLGGQRYYSLFDDAMISMRYASNLVHGRGLVWNAGERIEGFTNPLWVLVMAIAVALFSRIKAVLAIQVLGAALLAASAVVFARTGGRLFRGSAWPVIALFEAGFYWLLTQAYPLRFWTHMGMEVSALLLISALAWQIAMRRSDARASSDRALSAAAALAAVAFLIRPDGCLVALPPLVLCLVRRDRARPTVRRIARAAAPLIAVVAATTAARLAYYGEWVPNTYRLKMGLFPLSFRLTNGLGFITPYLHQVLVLLVVGAVACMIHRTRRTLALAAAPIVLIAYQIYVGGDPWPYWRQLTPGYPVLLLLALHVIAVPALLLRRRVRRARPVRQVAPLAALALLALALAPTRAAFADDAPLTFNRTWNELNVARALFLQKVLRPDARIAVLWGGATPYYDADRYAIDLLGKCDRVVAGEPPDLSGTLAWGGMTSVPGHNKSKISHSLLGLDADYAELVAWGSDRLPPVERRRFKSYFVGQRGYYFRRGSPRVDGDALATLTDAPKPPVRDLAGGRYPSLDDVERFKERGPPAEPASP